MPSPGSLHLRALLNIKPLNYVARVIRGSFFCGGDYVAKNDAHRRRWSTSDTIRPAAARCGRGGTLGIQRRAPCSIAFPPRSRDFIGARREALAATFLKNRPARRLAKPRLNHADGVEISGIESPRCPGLEIAARRACFSFIAIGRLADGSGCYELSDEARTIRWGF